MFGIGYGQGGLAHLFAMLVWLAFAVVVLMLAVGWVSPGNKRNTIGRAVVVALIIGVAPYLTLAHWPVLWLLVLPLVLYILVVIGTIAIAYGVGFARSLLLALALGFLSWVVKLLFGIKTF